MPKKIILSVEIPNYVSDCCQKEIGKFVSAGKDKLEKLICMKCYQPCQSVDSITDMTNSNKPLNNEDVPRYEKHEPGCLKNKQCAVYHVDGICPGPYGKCTCLRGNPDAKSPTIGGKEIGETKDFTVENIRKFMPDAVRKANEDQLSFMITNSEKYPCESCRKGNHENCEKHSCVCPQKYSQPPVPTPPAKEGWEIGAFYLAKTYADASYLVSEENHDISEEATALKALITFIRTEIAAAKKEERERIVKLIVNLPIEEAFGSDYENGMRKMRVDASHAVRIIDAPQETGIEW